jgi:hypothetical protein
LATNSTAITKIKEHWERAEFWLEVASVVGGLMVGVGLWIEGETTIGQRLVTGGVAMEVICAWWVLVASRKLQNILETEFEKLRLETAEAKRAQAQAELDLEQLRAIVLWRHIAADKFLAVLYGRPKPRNTEIVYLRDDPEVWSLANEVFTLLHKADWPATFPTPIKPNEASIFSSFPTVLGVGGSPTGGISLVANEELKMPTWENKTALGSLVNAFLAGLGGSVGINRPLPEHDKLAAGAIRIVVGPRTNPAWSGRIRLQ